MVQNFPFYSKELKSKTKLTPSSPRSHRLVLGYCNPFLAISCLPFPPHTLLFPCLVLRSSRAPAGISVFMSTFLASGFLSYMSSLPPAVRPGFHFGHSFFLTIFLYFLPQFHCSRPSLPGPFKSSTHFFSTFFKRRWHLSL